MTELVRYDAAHGVATLTLDSPHNRNALSRQLVGELYELLDRAAADDDAKVVVIRAEGRTFCSGADLAEAAEDRMEEAAGVLVDLQRRIVDLPQARGHPAARQRPRRWHRHRRRLRHRDQRRRTRRTPSPRSSSPSPRRRSR